MKILLNGALGYMGREVVRLCGEGFRGSSLAFGVDPTVSADTELPVFQGLDAIPSSQGVDCIIDFSHHSVTASLIDFAVANKLPIVIATTGHTLDEQELIMNASEKIPVFYSRNMSLGIALLIELAKTAAAAMPDADIEIVEKHHNRKVDAPSGTAFMIAEGIESIRPDVYAHNGRSGMCKREKNEIGIHAIRMGNIIGEHEVYICTPSQTITLKHEAHNRALFAEGAIAAAAFLVNQEPGFYQMNDMIDSVRRAEDTVISAD
jgi:4-hydroxy-tetrahydrodipicolinate reductase